jgi:hypothetical protein
VPGVTDHRKTALMIGILVFLRGLAAHAEGGPGATAFPADQEAPVTPLPAPAPHAWDDDARREEARRRSREEIDHSSLTDGDWYGAQILSADAAAVGLGLVCSALHGEGACLLPYVLGGPAVHIAHGQAGRAAASLVMRVSLPFLGGLAGLRLSDNDAIDDVVVGVLTGVVAASLVDAVFAFDSHGAAPEPPKRATHGFSMAPSLAIGRGDAVAGVVGRF